MQTIRPQKLLILLCVVIQLASGSNVTEDTEQILETTTEFLEVEVKPTEFLEVEVTPTELLELEVTTDAVETTTEFIDDYSTTSATGVALEDYAVEQMTFILNHILRASYDFVTQVLQETRNSVYPKDKLKSYAELLLRVLNADEENGGAAVVSAEYSYNMMLRKSMVLKGKTTKHLHKYLPEEWVEIYLKYKQDISVWLDKTAEQMHSEFGAYVSDEEDPVKHQYFNESFDDIPRANEIHQKLAILLDLVKIATNKKQITFMDLYMQS